MIIGEKVGLRAIEIEDLDKLKQWRNNTDFRKNFREVRELNQSNQLSWFEKLNKSNTDFMFGIVRLSDGDLIGACGLLYVNWINRSADFSFYIGVDNLYVDNLGYSIESVKMLIDYGFDSLNLNKIWMELYEFDHLKINFFKESFNFQIDGCLRDNCFEAGKYWDSYIISLLKNDYNN